MHVQVIDSLESLGADEWNRLDRDDSPFLSHEFLVALERNGCVGDAYGWYPRYLLIRDQQDRLVAAAPAYIKTNSYGEFVFDWSWAEAYQRNGVPYYPKLVVGVPFNPVTGPRMLLADDTDAGLARSVLAGAALELSRQLGLSGVHWLFTTETETLALEHAGLMRRMGCQYHWHNPGYRDFDDYLDRMIARKRKSIRRERKRPLDEGIELRIRHGSDLNDADCVQIHRYYESTFERKWGTPTLNAEFFREIATTLGDRLVVSCAYRGRQQVAAAIMFRSDSALYGRFWGCEQDVHSLHFEACYYQGIDYCIAHGLQRFEPGAQGEHKISRGFLPVPTWSAHWLEDSRFRSAIRRYLHDETEAVAEQCEALRELSPFRGDRDASAAGRR